MLNLYYYPGACSLAPHLALEWIGAPYVNCPCGPWPLSAAIIPGRACMGPQEAAGPIGAEEKR